MHEHGHMIPYMPSVQARKCTCVQPGSHERQQWLMPGRPSVTKTKALFLRIGLLLVMSQNFVERHTCLVFLLLACLLLLHHSVMYSWSMLQSKMHVTKLQ